MEGGGVIGEEGESRVVISGLLCCPRVVDWFFNFFYDSGDLVGEFKEAVFRHFPYHIGGWDHDRWQGDGCFFGGHSDAFWGGDTSPASFVGEDSILVCPLF